MQELPLNALRVFAEIHAHGGIRAAARALGQSHSAVSRHLAELSGFLGVALVQPVRGRAPLTFTPQGEALARAVRSGLGEIAEQVAALRQTRSAQAVVLSAAPSVAIRWLLPRLPSLERAHPRVELAVLVEQRLEDLAGGQVDLAIRMGRGPWPGLACEPLMEDTLYPVTSPAYWEAHGRPDRPEQLAGLRLLHDRDPQAAWSAWRSRYGPAGLSLQGGGRYASSDLVLRAAQLGQGVALARDRLVADDLAAGSLLRPFGERELPLGPAYWMVRPEGRARPAVAAVIDWLRWQAAG